MKSFLPFLLLLLLLLHTSPSLATLTLTCFSFPIASLPTFGFSSSAGLYITNSGSFLTSVTDTGVTFDACFLGLVAFLIFEVLPGILNIPAVASLQKRLQENREKYNYLDRASHYQGYFIDEDSGTRRLDEDVSNYIDTSANGVDFVQDNYNSVDIVEVSPPVLIDQRPTAGSNSPPVGNPLSGRPVAEYNLQDHGGWYRGEVAETAKEGDIDYTSGDFVSYHASLS